MSIKSTVTAALLASVATTGLLADDIAIKNGYLVTLTEAGMVKNGTVLISDGKITAIGADIEIPEGYRIIDATDMIVTPGFMSPYSRLGLNEGPSWAGVADTSAQKSKVNIGLDVTHSINPTQSMLNVQRIEGITRVGTNITGSQNLFGSQGAIITLDDDATVQKSKAYINMRFGDTASVRSGTRSAAWQEITTTFADAKKYGDAMKPKETKKKKSKKKAVAAKPAKPDLNKAALARVVSGEASLVVNVNLSVDIKRMITLKGMYPDMNMVLYGAAEAWMVADELADAGISVILDPMSNLPGNFERLGATQFNAGRLEAAGVKTAFLPNDGDANTRLIVQGAGNAVANGMTWMGAMKSLTVNPASMMGLDGEYGTLAVGMDADVVVWDGDPLEVMSSPANVIIEGEEVPLQSRQTLLRDRYKVPSRAPAYNK